MSGERHGYYADFAGALAKVLTRGYFHDGTYSTFRHRSHGRTASHVPGYRFVCCAQNHDQIGNRAEGDRLAPDALRLAAGLLLTSPFTPMLFMGEEWGRARRSCSSPTTSSRSSARGGRPAAAGVRRVRLRRLGGKGPRPR
ncbi:hypothetical protein ACFQX6_31295 [Streptosporangium lutulentum]